MGSGSEVNLTSFYTLTLDKSRPSRAFAGQEIRRPAGGTNEEILAVREHWCVSRRNIIPHDKLLDIFTVDKRSPVATRQL